MFAMFRAKVIVISLALATASAASAAHYKVSFQGSEARAVQSSVAPAAGYLGVPAAADPANLSNPGPHCAPSLYHGAGTPNQIVTFLHPYTNKAITVPLTLPAGKPTVVVRSDRIIYNYGLFSHRVVVQFLPNGRVDVHYRG